MCGSPFNKDSHPFDQDPETPQNNFYQEKSSTVHNQRLIPTTTISFTCLPSPVKCASAGEITTEELLKLEQSNSYDDKANELIIFKLSIPSLSLEPLTGKEIVDRVSDKADEVISRYLPCVELLVACQQDLRQGLTQKTTRRGTATTQDLVSF